MGRRGQGPRQCARDERSEAWWSCRCPAGTQCRALRAFLEEKGPQVKRGRGGVGSWGHRPPWGPRGRWGGRQETAPPTPGSGWQAVSGSRWPGRPLGTHQPAG